MRSRRSNSTWEPQATIQGPSRPGSRRRLLRAAAAVLCAGSGNARSVSDLGPGALHAAAKPASVALVLGGGGCRGYSHTGVLKALEAAGHRPDLIVGSSVGSLVGALYASGMTASDLERDGRSLDANTLRSWSWPSLGIFSGAAIARFVRARTSKGTIEDLDIRFAAVATDLSSGELVVLYRGDVGRAVQASGSLPGLFEPVRIEGRLCVDGNLAAPVPVSVARRLGAARVVAVDITFPPAEASLGNPIDALYQGFSILTRRLAQAERKTADVVIEPPIPVHNDMLPATLAAMIDAGEKATLAVMPSITKLFASIRNGRASVAP